MVSEFEVMKGVRTIIFGLAILPLPGLSAGCGGAVTEKSGSMEQIKHKFPPPPEIDGHPRRKTHRSTGLQRHDITH